MANRYSERAPQFPFVNGRALPSKWEDAEKWILSPAITNAGYHRRPKSKSGPLGPPGYLSTAASPLVDLVGNSSIGVGGGRSSAANAEAYIIRSASIHGWSDTVTDPVPVLLSSLPICADNKNRSNATEPPKVLSKDAATQMSPDGSPRSSASPPHAPTVEDTESKDVLVDDHVTVTSFSTANETAKSISMYKREEAKITAWENLQKAKAEEAIRKLEMKLEKKKFSSMEKILSKLKSAQTKAQEMRSAVTANQAEMVVGVTKKSYYFRKSGKIASSNGCLFTRTAF